MMMKSAIAALIATYVSATRLEAEVAVAGLGNDCANTLYWDDCLGPFG